MDPCIPDEHSDRAAAARLRRAVLALVVLDDVQLSHGRDGVDMPGGGHLSWQDITETLGIWADHPAHPVTRARLMTLVTAGRLISTGGHCALASALRVHVAPSASVLDPGVRWPVQRLGHGTVVAGWGLTGVPGARCTRPLPAVSWVTAALQAAISAGTVSWVAGLADVERLGELLVHRLTRDVDAGLAVVLRPMGDTDVATLLLSRALRSFLAGTDGSGMAALGMPTRWRAWSDVRRVDPAFVRAAWSATGQLDRGYPGLLLVTADDVVLPRGIRDVVDLTVGDRVLDPVAGHAGRG